MSDSEWAEMQLIASLVAFDRAWRESPEVKKVLPPDCDLDAELSALFEPFSE